MNKDHPHFITMSPLLVVADLEKSLAYYTHRLGFSIDFRFENFYAGIIKDGCSIHLKAGLPNSEIKTFKKEAEDIDITFSITQIDDFFELG